MELEARAVPLRTFRPNSSEFCPIIPFVVSRRGWLVCVQSKDPNNIVLSVN